MRTFLASTAASIALAGCATIGALDEVSEPLDAYQLRASLDGPSARGRAQETDVIIEVPTASAAIDTEGILIRPQSTQVQYLPGARWIESAPLMIQSALVDGLERTGAFRFVGRRPLGPSGDYALITSIGAFEAVLLPDRDGATVHVRITARLLREDDARIVATKTVSTSTVAVDTETASIVRAYDTAATKAIDEIIAWVLTSRGVRVANR